MTEQEKKIMEFFEKATDAEFDSYLEDVELQINKTIEENKDKLVESINETIEGNEYMDDVVERVGLNEDGVNTVRLSYQAKLKRAESQAAMLAAKEAGDILYERYTKFNRLRLSLKKQIKDKYSAQGQVRAREAMKRSAQKKNK